MNKIRKCISIPFIKKRLNIFFFAVKYGIFLLPIVKILQLFSAKANVITVHLPDLNISPAPFPTKSCSSGG